VGTAPLAVPAVKTVKARTCRSRSPFASSRFFTYSTANCKVTTWFKSHHAIRDFLSLLGVYSAVSKKREGISSKVFLPKIHSYTTSFGGDVKYLVLGYSSFAILHGAYTYTTEMARLSVM